jgi:hypothetical protein
MARELIVPSQGGTSDHVVPLNALEKEKVRILVKRLVSQPKDARDDIKNLADILHFAGPTAGAGKMGLWREFRALARQHPQEFIEECGGDPAQQAREALFEKFPFSCQVSREGMAVKLRVFRDELAGPRPSAVEWHLADAAALAWADYHRCVIERENLTDRDDWRLRSYHDQRLDRAHKRFIRSMKALADVRKLDLTAIQININDVVDKLPSDAAASASP